MTGRIACLLLSLVWFLSMGIADANAYSYVPLHAGMAVLLMLTLSAMIRGAKAVQLSKTAWISLGVGAYFLIRCLCGPSVVEAWQEASVILGCGCFYIAGVYAAQGRSLRTVLCLLVIAGLLNLLFFALMNGTDVPMEWTGRPSVGPGSVNHRPVTLFVYKNHAAAFLCMVGMLLLAASLWVKKHARARILMGIPALACVLVSAQCHSRAPFLMAPVMLIAGWILWVIISLYEDNKLGGKTIISGFLILSMLGVGICSALLESDIFRFFTGIDSHSRFAIWQATCRLLPETPLWGNGAQSAQWLTLPLQDRQFPFSGIANMVHNEYLQVWVDYGILGLFGMVYVVGWHTCRGIMIMASESVPSRQRIFTALALLCLTGWCICSFVDFFWHHFAIAGMTAFAAGITASPYSYTNIRKGIRRKISLQTPGGKGLLALTSLIAISSSLWLIYRTGSAWASQWEFNRLSAPGADESGELRHALITRLVPQYPATALMDRYFHIPRNRDAWEQEAELLRITLEANPNQMFTAVMLAEILSRHGRYEEAETVYRRYYPGDGTDSAPNGDWAHMYALNVLRRGQHLWATGEHSTAFSLLQYGLRITEKQPASWSVNRLHRKDTLMWSESGKFMPNWPTYIKAREQDVRVMQILQVEPDDSWQAPDASGKPALYRRYGVPESLKTTDSADSAPPSAKKE